MAVVENLRRTGKEILLWTLAPTFPQVARVPENIEVTEELLQPIEEKNGKLGKINIARLTVSVVGLAGVVGAPFVPEIVNYTREYFIFSTLALSYLGYAVGDTYATIIRMEQPQDLRTELNLATVQKALRQGNWDADMEILKGWVVAHPLTRGE